MICARLATRGVVLALVGVVAFGIAPRSADAFVRTLTCRAGADPAVDNLACQDGQTPVPLFWDSSCVVLHTNEAVSTDIEDPETAHQAIRDSMDSWSEVTCSYLSLIDGGLTDEDRVGYNRCAPDQNANVVMFRRSGWTHQRGVLALTSVTYDMDTGQIIDADVELNDESFTFTTTELIPIIDVQNTITHELGHFIGLDHSPDTEATMFASAGGNGETEKRDLAQDDIDAICSAYPVGNLGGLVCDQSSVGYFSRPEQAPNSTCDDDGTGCGCHTASMGSRIGGAFGAALSLVFVAILFRRRAPLD